MESLLVVKIPLMVYRYLNNYGPNDEPVSSISLGIIETSEDEKSLPNGWYCSKSKCSCCNVCCSGACNEERNPSYGFCGQGYILDDNLIILLFNEVIGNNWSMKTLVSKGTNLKSAPFPIYKVDFSPSLENMAYYIYNVMNYEICKNYKARILYVEVQKSSGTFARFPALI